MSDIKPRAFYAEACDEASAIATAITDAFSGLYPDIRMNRCEWYDLCNCILAEIVGRRYPELGWSAKRIAAERKAGTNSP